MKKVYHVEIKGNEPKHLYFGSQVAIYETFTAEELGVGYKSLMNNCNLDQAPYENKKCIIRKGYLRSKKSNRGQGLRTKH